jgi:alpha-glucosidase
VIRAVRFAFVVPVFLFLAATSQANNTAEAQQKSGFVRLDRVTASRATFNGIEIHTGAAIMQIAALRDDVRRIRVGSAWQLPEDASWAVLPSSH